MCFITERNTTVSFPHNHRGQWKHRVLNHGLLSWDKCGYIFRENRQNTCILSTNTKLKIKKNNKTRVLKFQVHVPVSWFSFTSLARDEKYLICTKKHKQRESIRFNSIVK